MSTNVNMNPWRDSRWVEVPMADLANTTYTVPPTLTRKKQVGIPAYAKAMLGKMTTNDAIPDSLGHSRTATAWSHVMEMTPEATLMRLSRLHDVGLVRRARRKLRRVEWSEWTVSEKGKHLIADRPVVELDKEPVADYTVTIRQRRTLGR